MLKIVAFYPALLSRIKFCSKINSVKTIVVIHNIRSILNVGSILRTCEGFGVSKVIYSGYTPTPNSPVSLPHVKEKINAAIHKTALGAEELVESEYTDDIKKTLQELKSQHYKILGLENNLKDKRLHKLNEPFLNTELGKASILTNKNVLILGEEVAGIPKELYDQIDVFLEIPMVGKKESFNVSVATGIALYKLLCE